MALPHMRSNVYLQKHAYEESLVRKRTFEDDYRKQWSAKADYFQKNNVSIQQHDKWSADKPFTNSVETRNQQDSKIASYKENLRKRRNRLAQLLESERNEHQLELANNLSGDGISLDFMKSRAEQLRSAREEQRKKDAEKLYYEHFRLNNPDLRKIESEIYAQNAVDHWSQQIQEKVEEKLQLNDEEREYEQMMSARNDKEKEDESRNVQKKILQERYMKDSLRRQMDELKQKEAEAKYLKDMEEKLLLVKVEMKDMEDRRCNEEKKSTQKEYGRALLRQHASALRRKSQQIQQELEDDLRFLHYLADKEKENEDIMSSRKEKAKLNVEWMREEMERQLLQERERENELDSMFAEEAARLWHKREAEWERERAARDELMKQVLAERKRQVEEKLEDTRLRQYESLQEREAILQDIEEERMDLDREKQYSQRKQSAYKDRLHEQMKENKEQHYNSQLNQQREFEREYDEEAAYEELLKREAEKLYKRGVPIRSARR